MPALAEWQGSEYASNLYKTSITFTILMAFSKSFSFLSFSTASNKSSAVLIHILNFVLKVLGIENR